MKLFLTGQRGAGKSYLIQTILKDVTLSLAGFLTLPYFNNDKERIGFCLYSLKNTTSGRNYVPFSTQKGNMPFVIKDCFNDFGVEILKQTNTKDLLILDEIGKLEREEHLFIKELKSAILKQEHVFGVLKKCEEEHLLWIRNLSDVKIIDLDQITYEEAIAMIKELGKEWMK